jgi:hypothetical protein
LIGFPSSNDGKGSTGRFTPPPQVPVDIKVGAFAVDSKLGLGIADPKSFATAVPLSISCELPATMQRGEAVAAVVVLKNTLTVDTSVEVTMYNTAQFFEFEPLENDINATKSKYLTERFLFLFYDVTRRYMTLPEYQRA